MLDLSHIYTSNKDVQVFYASAVTAGTGWQTWKKPRGCTFMHIFALAGGGGGGNGAVGAASTAAGGGGGASGSQYSAMYPLWMIPDALFVSVGYGGAAATAGIATYISLNPDTNTSNLLTWVTAGGAGGNASGATAGTVGSNGGVTSMVNAPRAAIGVSYAGSATNVILPGQNGIAGGTTSVGGALTLPTTGLVVTGGTGGGGVGIASSVGAAGGAFTVAGVFPPQSAGAAGSTSTSSGGAGSNGFQAFRELMYFYGGTGGASSGGTSGSGGAGGAGSYGCGGGGGGGGRTSAGAGGRGGDGLVIITAW